MSSLAKYRPVKVDAFLDDWKVDLRDDVKLRIKGGVVSAVVKRQDGRVHSATTMLEGQFQRRTAYNSFGSSPAERRKLVRKLRKEGLRQTAIAELLGVSQATVSLDLKK